MDGSTLGYNLITSHQVECMPSVLITAEAVERAHVAFALLYPTPLLLLMTHHEETPLKALP